MSASPLPDSQLTGFLYGLGAFGFWGLTPLYFKAVGHVPALEVMAHRVIWAMLLMLLLLLWRRRLRDRKSTRLNSSHSQQSRMPSSA